MPSRNANKDRYKPDPSVPAHAARVGRVVARCWRHVGRNGPWYAVRVDREFVDPVTGRRTYAVSLNAEDLAPAAEALRLVDAWIRDRPAPAPRSKRQRQPVPG